MADQLIDPEKIIEKYKLVILGDVCVGKTQIINMIMYKSFDSKYDPTIGIDFLVKGINLGDRTVRLQLWDTSGQERFRSLIPSYIQNSQVAVIIFDITNRQSFINSDKWFQEVKNEITNNAVIFYVGNKSDKREQREVAFEEAVINAKLFDAIYIETSAKTGDNINQLFGLIVDAIWR